MSYINSYGATAGPLKIDKTWLSTITGYDSNVYCSISADRESQYYRPVLAGTPNIGYSEATGDFAAPDNAVITVGWFKATKSYDFTKLPSLSIEDFAKKDDLVNLQNDVAKLKDNQPIVDSSITNIQENINTLSANISALGSDTKENSDRVLKIHEWVVGHEGYDKKEAYPKKIIIQCGNAASFIS